MKSLRKIINAANRVEEWLVILVFSVMILAVFAQVVNRNIIQLPIGWYEELARYCQVYLALLAMELGLRDGSQIALTTLTDKLPQSAKKVLAVLAKIVVVTFSLIMFLKSITLFQGQLASGQCSPGLKVAMSIPYFALPLSFGIASLVQSCTLIQLVLGIFRKNNGEEVSA